MQPIAPRSFWHETTTPGAAYPALQENIRADVCVIGAGITGLTAALALKRAGKNVVVLEAGRVGAGTTGGTTAHLEVLPDQGCSTLINDFGEDAARQITASRQAAINQIERWIQEHQIDCDFRRIPAFEYTEKESHIRQLEKECAAAQRLGIQASMTDETGLPFEVAAAIRYENQARFHPLKYLQSLARLVHGDGCAIYEETRAELPQDGTPCTVPTAHGVVTADQVILATHSAYLGISVFDMRMEPMQSYVVAVHVSEPPPDALYWDDADPYHYTRWADSSKPGLLLIGGADHKTGHGDPSSSARQLEEYVQERFRAQAIQQHWSAEFFEPDDGVPFIGRVPTYSNTYIGTGYSGVGMTYGTVAGLLMADLVQGREPPLAKVYLPSRLKPIAGGAALIKENVDVAVRFVADRFAGEPIEALEEIGVGEGRLVKYQGEQLAAYRDDAGQLHLLSPVCTHAGCHVKWNTLEKTWDCPCHGGRYSACGERIYGPPTKDLEVKSPQSLAAS